MANPQHSHRPSSQLHQSHKPFKSRYQTKGQLKAKLGGKVAASVKSTSASGSIQKKADRKNALKLEQQKKRREVLNQQRFFAGKNGAPKITALIPLNDLGSVDTKSVVSRFFDICGLSIMEHGDLDLESKRNWIVDCRQRFKQQLQIVEMTRTSNETEWFLDVLDACKVADYVVFLVSCQDEVDSIGKHVLASIRAQGLPSCHCIMMGLNDLNVKKQNEVKKYWSHFMKHELASSHRPFSLEHDQDLLNLIRLITSSQPTSIQWRDMHPYMIADGLTYCENSKTLAINGTARGMPFSANRLIHLQSFGDFQLSKIHVYDSNSESIEREVFPNPDMQETLEFQLTPDPMANEQTWPTDEELMDAEKEMILQNQSKKIPKRVPKGTSSYQASWLDDEDEDGAENEEDQNNMAEDDCPLDEANDIHATEEEKEEYQSVVSEERQNDDEDDWSDDEERRRLAEYLTNKADRKNKSRSEEYQEDMEFPDEKDVPLDMPARIRFQKYRGLRSFRTSEWDPYENLPIDYARIYQFDDFKSTQKTVAGLIQEEKYLSMSETNPDQMNDHTCDPSVFCVAPGRKVTLFVSDVPAETYRLYCQSMETKTIKPFIVFGLLPHEQKMSILNFSVTRPRHEENENIVIKSKDKLLVSCGFRRYVNAPIYSQATNGSLHKFERFFPNGQTVIGTVYAPVSYQPCPVLLFNLVKKQENAPDEQPSYPQLVATGSVQSMDPTRMLIKRIVLTGPPTRIHKSSRHKHTAVVRYMFFNPEDIEYFKPIELKTKYGRRGHIIDSIGTHGAMKCGFDKTIQSMDTVCMMLYKRVFPKWPEFGYHSLFGPRSEAYIINRKVNEEMEQ